MSFLSFLRGLEDPNAPKRVTSVAATKVPRPSGKPISARVFTLAEVAQHATESDCYTIVEGRVYDVTKYLRLHPGGMKLLYKNAGGDSTADFLALRHSVKSRTILDHYYVGELASAHQSTLSVHPAQPTVTRPVGSMVGSQPFLSVAPASGGSLTPTPSVAHVYPPPRSGALHPSSSHPDRLSAYRDQAQSLAKAAPPALPTIVASSSDWSSEPAGGLSIQLHPPAPRAALPPSTPSPPSSLSLQRSPTTEALEQHLASALSPTTPSDESPSSMNDGSGSEVDSANSPLKMVAPMRAQSDPPAKQTRARASLPQVPRFDEVPVSATAAATTAASAPMDTSDHVVQPAPIVVPQVVSAAVAALFFAGLSGPASVLPSHVAAAPPAAAAAPSLPAGLGPRPFVLVKRIQKTHDVQHLTFEPSFPTTTSSSSASVASSSQSASSSTATTTGHQSLSPSHASALDPALWLHVPCGLHVSLGVTLADGTYVKRPYTPVRNVGGTLEFVIKSYPHPYGLLSRHLHALPLSASAGGGVASPASIDVWGPFGRFDYEHALAAGKQRWVMIAQGTGVAPMYQLLKFHAQEVDQQRAGQPNGYPKHLALHLLACYRTREDRLLLDELDQVKEQALGRITVQHVITQASTSSNDATESTAFDGARLNASMLDRYLASIPGGASASSSKSSPLFLLCGSDDFHLQVMAMLLASPLGAKSEDDIFCF